MELGTTQTPLIGTQSASPLVTDSERDTSHRYYWSVTAGLNNKDIDTLQKKAPNTSHRELQYRLLRINIYFPPKKDRQSLAVYDI